MKNSIRTPFLMFVLLMGFGWASVAQAGLLGIGSAKFENMNIYPAYGLEFSYFNQKTTVMDYDYPTGVWGGSMYNDWADHSYSYTDANRSNTSLSSDAEISTNSSANLDNPGMVYFDAIAERSADINVTQSGLLEIVMDFSMYAGATNSGNPGSLATSRTDMFLDILNQDTGANIIMFFSVIDKAKDDGTHEILGWDRDLDKYVPYINAWESGTLSTGMYFNEGETGTIKLSTSTHINLNMPVQSVPEPSILALLGFGLVFLGFKGSKKR